MKRTKAFITICLIAGLSNCLWMTSCRQEEKPPFLIAEQIKADSMMYTIRHTDSLKLWTERYKLAENHEGEMMAWRHLGKRYREDNEFVKAIEAHTAEFSLAERMTDTISMMQSLNNLGTCYRRMSMLDEACKHHYEALKLYSKYSDKENHKLQKNRVISLNGIGNISLSIGDYTTADSVFKQALNGEKWLKSHLGQAINYANLGATYERRGKLDSAWYCFRKSMDHNKKAKSDLGVALCYEHYGDLYMKQGDIKNCIISYNMAYEMKEKIDAWHWQNICLALAKIHIDQKNHDRAKGLLKEIEKGVNEGKSLDQMAEMHALYYEMYLQEGNAPKALNAYQNSQKYRDSILNREKMITLQNERARYEYGRRQEEIDAIKAEYHKEKFIKNNITITLVITVVLATIIILLMRNALKMKEKEKILKEHLNKLKDKFYTQTTNEFRTPLTMIIGMGKKLRDYGNTKANTYNWSHIGEIIVRQGDNMMKIVNETLEISQMTQVTRNKPYRHGDLVAYIKPLIEHGGIMAYDKDIKIYFASQFPVIEMDFVPEYIDKIVLNLISNAVKYTPENGRIDIMLYTENSTVIFDIKDNGCGIRLSELPHIFDIFFQGSNNEGKTGVGVGLSLARELARAMGGDIKAYSWNNEGCKFMVSLPKNQEGGVWEDIDKYAIEDKYEEYDKKCLDMEGQYQLGTFQPKVLLVIENEELVQDISSMLENATLYVAHTGSEGLDRARFITPDIIITELEMTEMHGMDFCNAIRESTFLSRIPIAIISDKNIGDENMDALHVGADAFITRPFSEKDLIITVKSLLERRNNLLRFTEHVPKIKNDNNEGLDENSKDFLDAVANVLYNQMMQQNVSIGLLSHALCMSPKQLNRRILSITGENASKFVLKTRMARAKQLIDFEKGASIAEVAMKCGYEENSNFTRAFRQYYNVTPSEYRDSLYLKSEREIASE